jgi:hypothetical protein
MDQAVGWRQLGGRESGPDWQMGVESALALILKFEPLPDRRHSLMQTIPGPVAGKGAK